jgi:hypothetical protein
MAAFMRNQARLWGLMVWLGVAGAGQAAAEPQWSRAPTICRQLRIEGWLPANPLGGSGAESEARVGGASDIYLCRVARTLASARRHQPAHVEVFLQHRGGDALTITVRFFDERDRRAALDAGAAIGARLVRELALPAPAGFDTAVRAGDAWSDDAGGLRFRISRTSRQEELVSQPDLTPDAVPLLAVQISIGAAEDGEDHAAR